MADEECIHGRALSAPCPRCVVIQRAASTGYHEPSHEVRVGLALQANPGRPVELDVLAVIADLEVAETMAALVTLARKGWGGPSFQVPLPGPFWRGVVERWSVDPREPTSLTPGWMRAVIGPLVGQVGARIIGPNDEPPRAVVRSNGTHFSLEDLGSEDFAEEQDGVKPENLSAIGLTLEEVERALRHALCRFTPRMPRG